ncbi:MAG: hypothetical protein CM1200mP41_07440 [Gammaproteobacteria bacterium]|nr:MAG: hypothetical protein CM1200mP41_07440 [Gammaproteobacteria bacterium]
MRHQLATAQLNSVQFTAPVLVADNEAGARSCVIFEPHTETEKRLLIRLCPTVKLDVAS